MKNLKSIFTMTLGLVLTLSIVGCASSKSADSGAMASAKAEKKAKEKAYDPLGIGTTGTNP